MQPHRISIAITARYDMSILYQWLSPAPMITIERPFVASALAAKPRATAIQRSRGTPVIASCQAGVKGASSS